jgi:rRNA maturation endonuclease Nob1
MPVAVLLNLTSFGLVVVAIVGLMIAVSIIYRHPTRPCHRCGRRVRLDKRVCGHCGYEFEVVRTTR